MGYPIEGAPTYQPRCTFIRCKAMLVFGENFQQDPEYDPDNAYFWCNQTGIGQGPDQGPVSMRDCTVPDRACYQEF